MRTTKVLTLLLLFLCAVFAAQAQSKPRIVIITDMTHDDGNTLIRYLHYANEFKLEAMIVTPQLPDFQYNSLVPWNKAQTIINAYGQVENQLRKHHPDFPTATAVRNVTKKGRGALPIIWLTNGQKFWDWIGEGNTPNGEPKDSEGSEFLQTIFENPDPSPIFVQFWGGPITFMQALYRYKQKHTAQQLSALLGKLYVYDICQQDITVDMMLSISAMKSNYCGRWDNATGTYGQPQLVPATFATDGGHFWDYLNAMSPTEVQGHGALSNLYDGGGEGDTPLLLVNISDLLGLNDARIPSLGSWGNMYPRIGGTMPSNYYGTCKGDKNELTRWKPDAKNSFIARLNWAVNNPGNVNRPPKPSVNGDNTNKIMYIDANPGANISLNASASIDPDGNSLSYRWFQYTQADSYTGAVTINNSTSNQVNITLPADLGDRNIHIVLELRDNGSPGLVAYKRIIAGKGVKDPFEPTQLSITTANLPDAQEKYTYSTFLAASGGKSPYTFGLAAGSVLPSGLVITSAGEIKGIPTVSGTFNTNFEVTDANNVKSQKSLPLKIIAYINTLPSIEAITLPEGNINIPYNARFVAGSGNQPFIFSEDGNNLSLFGLSLSSEGTISGTPSIIGTCTFRIKLSDRDNEFIINEYSITVTSVSSVFVSDLTWASATVGYGTIKKDRSADGNTIKLNGTTYAKGIGTHAVSDITYNLGGAYNSFSAIVGLDDEIINAESCGSVIFKVYGDGTLQYTSPKMLANSTNANVQVDVTGVNTLRLSVEDAGNGICGDHGDWADAKLTTSSSTIPVTGVSVSPTSTTVNVGSSVDLIATVAPTNATNKNVTWSSSNTSVATVNSSGSVTGVATGNATITVTTQDGNKTATCAITVQTSSECTLYQAETDYTGSSVVVATNNAGYTGSGFLDYGGQNSYAEWNISVTTAGSYTFKYRYGNGSTGNRQCEFRANGSAKGNVAFAPTGSWSTWGIAEFTVTLNAGNNTIRLTANTSAGGPNLDNYEICGGTPPVYYTLTTTSPNGSIIRNPNATTYASGTVVSLTANPSAGYIFSNWTGDATGTTNPVSITMNANKSVTANFAVQSVTDCILTNPSFESDLQSWTINSGTIAISTSATDGLKSARLYGTNAGMEQGYVHNVATGTTVTVTFDARIAGTVGWAGVGLDFKNASNVDLLKQNVQITNTAWQAKTIVANAPAGTEKLNVWAYTSSGELYVDDFCISGTGLKSAEVTPSFSAITSLMAYPNPVTHGELNLVLEDRAEMSLAKIEMFDITGRVVYMNEISFAGSLSHRVDCSSISKGIYYVHVKTTGLDKTIKIVVQ